MTTLTLDSRPFHYPHGPITTHPAVAELVRQVKTARRTEHYYPPRVYCVLRHVSRSGMFRVIDLYIQATDGSHLNVYGLAEKVGGDYAGTLPYTYDTHRNGFRVSGCGMDMGFALVYDLSMRLFGNGYAVASYWV